MSHIELTEQQGSSCPFDHHDPTVVGDEYYAMYAQLRGERVSWSDRHGGFWLVSQYADAKAVLSDHATFSSAGGVMLPTHVTQDGGGRSSLLESDPPEHGPGRKLVVEVFGRGAVLGRENDLRELVDGVVAEFVSQGGGDAVEEISERLPVEAIALMLGLSPESASRVREMTVDVWKRIGTDPGAGREISAMLLAEALTRRDAPRDDALTALLNAEVGGERLSEQQIAGFLVGGVVAGHQTTLNASSNLLHGLSRDLPLQQALRDDLDRIPGVVEESLRYRAPIHLFFRTATRDVTLGDAEVRTGDKVGVLYASANRDDVAFDRAECFLADRNPNPHLSFGWGIHRCPGAFLAQTELRLLAQSLLAAGTVVPDGDPEHAPMEGGHHMGFRRLPLKILTGDAYEQNAG